ncbi:MAG: thioredoxin [Planctomycetota bacterium]|nr:MAG: thioredoxin [Planctomycetota bacterium]
MDCQQLDATVRMKARGNGRGATIGAGGVPGGPSSHLAHRWRAAVVWSASLLVSLPVARADADPRLAKALSYKPLQSDVRYERVSDADIENCSIEETTRQGVKGFWITGPAGQPLRWFADTNKDNRLDRWSYYNAGVEVYRESDTDFNGTADEFRWLSTEGTRRGIDADEDGTIDRWEMISAEEVTAEIVAAAAARDPQRFARLLLSDEELDGLGLSDEQADALGRRVEAARAGFEEWAKTQTGLTRSSRWTNFGADKPGIVPAGTNGSTRDLMVYENVVALFEDGGQPKQLLVGTLVRVGDAWRAVELPRLVTEGATIEDGGMFFAASFSPRGDVSSGTGLSGTLERLVAQLQEIDEKLLSNPGEQAGSLHARRADVLEKLVSAAEDPTERSMWIRQFADTVSAAAQTGEYPEGADRLRDFVKKLAGVRVDENDMAYVVFRTIETDYRMKSLAAKEDEIDDVQKAYLASLEAFTKRFPDSPDTAEAMVQIALSAEFAGEVDKAKQWYDKARQAFPQTIPGKKAAGALRRLQLEGQPFQLTAKTLDGRTFRSSAYTGSPVIYHCWATWCDGCKAEMRALKQLQAKYAKQGLRIVGINFDSSPELARQFLQQNSYPWVHLFDEGGFESDLAIGYGILTLPVNFVVDARGRVVKTGVHWTELDELIGKLVQ